MTPGRLDIPLALHLQILSRTQKPVADLSLSPISTIDYAFFLSPGSPLSPVFSPNAGPGVVLTKEEEEREEKAIAEKGFYLHRCPRGGENSKGARPELLPLFPVNVIASPKAIGVSSPSS